MATGLSVTSTSNLSSGQKILVANAIAANEPAAPDPDLVWSHRIPQGHKSWDILTYARLDQASALTEGVDLSVTQQLVTNALSITPTEHGLLTTLSKSLMRRQGDTNVQASAGAMMGKSLRRRHANDVIALYDGFSKSLPGAGQTLDINDFRGAVSYLLTDNASSYGPAEPPFIAALHIEQISDIIADIAQGHVGPTSVVGSASQAGTGSRFGFSAEMLQRWWKAKDRLYGVEVFHSGNIALDSNLDVKGAIFAQQSLVTVVANEADTTEQDDNSLRAIEYGIFQEWGEGERADGHGVEIFSDAEAHS
jgi:hypothetical protein